VKVHFKAYSLIELLLVLFIIGVVSSTLIIPKFKQLYLRLKFYEEVATLENVLKRAKSIAIEESSYIKVDAERNTLKVYNCGLNPACSNMELLNQYTFSFSLKETRSSGVLFSPRGLAHYQGSFCLEYDTQNLKVRFYINRVGIRKVEGIGC